MSILDDFRKSPNYGKGLFQTNLTVGLLQPILRNPKGGDHKLVPWPCHNNSEGELEACRIMDEEDFVDWAIDPWTSEINIEMV
jgi:hypothetical protein